MMFIAILYMFLAVLFACFFAHLKNHYEKIESAAERYDEAKEICERHRKWNVAYETSECFDQLKAEIRVIDTLTDYLLAKTQKSWLLGEKKLNCGDKAKLLSAYIEFKQYLDDTLSDKIFKIIAQKKERSAPDEKIIYQKRKLKTGS